MSLTRRGFALSLAAACSGCGFHPVYSGGEKQDAQLGAVFVDIIPNRYGQLLRQSLQQRLEGSDSGVSKKYVLGVFYTEGTEGLGIQNDNSSTRLRDIATAAWSLHVAGPAGAQLASGKVRSVDGYNIIDEQFFYSDLEEDAAQHRMGEAIADQIVQALGIFFRKHPELA